jgi:hypothetical protein
VFSIESLLILRGELKRMDKKTVDENPASERGNNKKGKAAFFCPGGALSCCTCAIVCFKRISSENTKRMSTGSSRLKKRTKAQRE